MSNEGTHRRPEGLRGRDEVREWKKSLSGYLLDYSSLPQVSKARESMFVITLTWLNVTTMTFPAAEIAIVSGNSILPSSAPNTRSKKRAAISSPEFLISSMGTTRK